MLHALLHQPHTIHTRVKADLSTSCSQICEVMLECTASCTCTGQHRSHQRPCAGAYVRPLASARRNAGNCGGRIMTGRRNQSRVSKSWQVCESSGKLSD